MSRKPDPGIKYFPMDANHVTNNKLKLLINEFDSHGYWIYQCMNCEIASKKGYYFDLNNEDDLILFASDICKKPVALVRDVLAACIRRGLYDKVVFEAYNVLTSDRIQSNYLEAKKELRRKGYVLKIISNYWIIEREKSETLKYFSLKSFNSTENDFNSTEESENSTEKGTQRRGEENKREEKRREERESGGFTPPTRTQVLEFFTEKKGGVWTPLKLENETAKFHGRYAGVGWVVGNSKTPISDWKAVAEKWITTDAEFKKTDEKFQAQSYVAPHTQKSESSEPTDSEKFEIAKNSILKSFSDFRIRGYFEDFGNSMFNHLVKTENQHFKKFTNGKNDDDYASIGKKKELPQGEQTMQSAIMKTIEDAKLNKADSKTQEIVAGKKIIINEFYKHLIDSQIELAQIL